MHITCKKFRTILISDKKVFENKPPEISNRPKYLQYSIKLLNCSKAASFLYGANSSLDTTWDA